MNISNISNLSNQTGNSVSNDAGNPKLGKDEFLQLLVAQMKNQDPINPMDGTQFASQLAQFNSVEQLINLNDGMNALAQSQQMMSNGLSNTMAASLAGKTVRALSNQVAVGENGDTELQFRINDIATEVEITITDESGNTIRKETIENVGSGDHSWNWDGKSDAGNRVPKGIYSIRVDAKNGDDQVPSLTFIEGVAEKVHYSGNGVELKVDGIFIPLGDVEDIGT